MTVPFLPVESLQLGPALRHRGVKGLPMTQNSQAFLLLDLVTAIQAAAGSVSHVRASGLVRRGYGARLYTLELRLLQTASTLGRVRGLTGEKSDGIAAIVRELRSEAARLILFHACQDAESIRELELIVGDLGALLAQLNGLSSTVGHQTALSGGAA